MWMNENDIDDALLRYDEDDVKGPATQTLAALLTATNRCSDGWTYWRKPSQAARKLMALIQSSEDATPTQLIDALRPIKAFRTRHRATGMEFEIYHARENGRDVLYIATGITALV